MRFFSFSGILPYAKAHELQKFLLEKRIADEIPDLLLFLEHEPVITRGAGLQVQGAAKTEARRMPLGSLPAGIDYVECERGGDLTYHGPGQLVVYPIIKLDGQGFGPKHDIGAFLRKFEQLFIDELASAGLPAARKEAATGVWVGEKKILSLGIAVRKWVTWHGAALNVVNSLAPFDLISPCGFSSEVMTSWQALQGERILRWQSQGEQHWREHLENRLAARMAQTLKIKAFEIEVFPQPRNAPLERLFQSLTQKMPVVPTIVGQS